MAYEPLKNIKSTLVLLDVDNVDTDQIIPARFLKATSRDADFGSKLFADWRYKKDGNPNEDFALSVYARDSRILLAGENFGCGSSREHAAWALYDYGFRVVLAKSYADIFKTNALNNGILPVVLSVETHNTILELIEANPDAEFEVDLPKQELSFNNGKERVNFEINPFRSQCLQEGADLLDFLVARRDQIIEFEQKN